MSPVVRPCMYRVQAFVLEDVRIGLRDFVSDGLGR